MTGSNKPYKVAFCNPDWGVFESPTEQMITVKPSSRAAKQTANQLNGGHGFRGFTPAYVLQSLQHVYTEQ